MTVKEWALAGAIIINVSCAASWTFSEELPPPAYANANAVLDEQLIFAKPDILFIGDSITAGWGERGLGHAVWNKYFRPLNAFELGIPGDTTSLVLWRIEHGAFEKISPRDVILLIGTNDIDSPDNIARRIGEIVSQIRDRLPSTTIIVFGVFPHGWSKLDPQRFRTHLINIALPNYLHKPNVTFEDIGDIFLQPDGSIAPQMMVDGTHLTSKGYELWAQAIIPLLRGHRH